MFLGHGGNISMLAGQAGKSKAEIVDFSASINPLGPPEYIRRIISRNIEQLCHYPDPGSTTLLEAIAQSLNLGKSQLVLGNGSTEIIYAVPRALEKKRAVIPVPCYSDYAAASRLAGLEVDTVLLLERDGFKLNLSELAARLRGDEIVFLGQPNNPTGLTVANNELRHLVESNPQTFFIIDESFAEFIDGYWSVACWNAANLIMIRSLTKFYAIPGLRIGFACAAPDICRRLNRYILSWTVNTLAQEVGAAVVGDREYGDESKRQVAELRQELEQKLRSIKGLHVFAGQANFLLVKIDSGATARCLADLLMQDGVAIRVCDNFDGFADRGKFFFRVAVKTRDENSRLVQLLARHLDGRRQTKTKRKGFSLMLQGTASNAGKSVLTAALCRILLQDGLRVAPFKAQNMSLNSYVTRDGLEMGRAQVVQAQACKLDPDVRMNPVLLKPSSDMGSQVIVNGRPVANMTVGQYIAYKPKAWQAVTAAYDSLSAEYDGIILEGAGSPAEVNLKHHDIVNMRMARYARSPVLLAGDIDRGGVFASFVGTMEVMAEWERKLVAGFVVNRFRGNQSLLHDAFHYTEAHTGRPVFGVVPYLPHLGLPEEDSVSFKSGLYDAEAPAGEHIDIALIDLPHISNFTDFEPFLAEPDVYLHIIRHPQELEAIKDKVAALILPGSKNVMTDLDYLQQSGIAECIKKIAEGGSSEIIGICGGFQMLGQSIVDPYSIESDSRDISGLSLLNMTTTLEKDKTLTRRAAVHAQSGLEVHGYEIHHGRSSTGQKMVLQVEKGERICASSADSMIWGTYLHGIFDADPFRRWFIDQLRRRRGLVSLGRVIAPYDLEAAFDRLADTVRNGLDMERIYRLLNL
ncbi:MAG: cobyric acid synthase [Desulfobulbaceae bacterium]|nr:cobyric acid synthase [Desulfobulbaceae bacterium]